MSPRRRSPPRRGPVSSRHRHRRSPVRRLVKAAHWLKTQLLRLTGLVSEELIPIFIVKIYYWLPYNLCTVYHGFTRLNVFNVFASCRRRSRSASSSGSSSSGSRSPKKAMKRISNTPPRKQAHHPDTSISPAGKDRRSPSPRGRRGRGSASPTRSLGMIEGWAICAELACDDVYSEKS